MLIIIIFKSPWAAVNARTALAKVINGLGPYLGGCIWLYAPAVGERDTETKKK